MLASESELAVFLSAETGVMTAEEAALTVAAGINLTAVVADSDLGLVDSNATCEPDTVGK